jgi:TPR repeat protein
MESLIRQFSNKLKQETTKVALFYYAGHGMQINDKNYLLPVDASVKDVTQLDLDVIKLDTVLQQMENPERANLIFLDACRNNPFLANLSPASGARSIKIVPSGLANIDSGAGLFISFAAGPNQVALDGDGRNSPFTAALLKHLETPGLDIARIQTRVVDGVLIATKEVQTPWSHSSLRREVILTAARPDPQTGGLMVTESPRPPRPVTRVDYAAECDEEAGYRDDPDRPQTNGHRAYKDIEPQKAVRICRLARDNSPSKIVERRMRLQIGRALAARGKDEAMRGDQAAARRSYAEAADEWRRAAEMNSGHAYNVLAAYLQGAFSIQTPTGAFVPAAPDFNEAFRYYKRSADLDNPHGLINAGILLIGLDTRFPGQVDERRGRLYLERARKLGVPRAYYAIGHSMMLGLGYEKNEREALRHLGVAYCRDNGQAKQFFDKHRNYAKPQCSGDTYVDTFANPVAAQRLDAIRANPAGDRCDQLAANPTDPRKPITTPGVPYNSLREQADEAVRVCQQAMASTPDELRYRYQLGRALQFSDRARAFAIHKELARRGYAAAFDNLGWIYFADRSDPHEAVRQFIAGAQAGDADAMVSLGEMIDRGHYTPPHATDAKLFLFKRAAELGHTNGTRAYELELSLMAGAQTRFSDGNRLRQQVSQFFQTVLGASVR